MDSTYFFQDLDLTLETLIGTGIMYLVIIVYTRLYGLKTFSKMTSFDFANTVAIGSLIASSIANGKPSLFLGVLLLGFLYLVNYILNFLRSKSSKVQHLMDNTPLLLMDGEHVLHHNLDRAKITEDELKAKLREANVLRLSQVKAVVLETTGDVSVLHSDKEISVEDYVLEGVRSHSGETK
jgi:uncharacterized membrane protein YcaP (DUF421 family)